MSRFIDSGSTMNIIIKGKLTIRPGENIFNLLVLFVTVENYIVSETIRSQLITTEPNTTTQSGDDKHWTHENQRQMLLSLIFPLGLIFLRRVLVRRKI